ncbi:XRE family transcriptional regulator [Kineosporia sp. NBRC 101731]|nr:XRE family transcriptional regulator [Kineosporia sp. NBRC 101731]
MSPDYYMRLEQARGPQPSAQLLTSLAGALRLNRDERDHLFLLAGQSPMVGPPSGRHVEPGLLYLLDHLTGTPAQVLNDLGDLLAQNPVAEALFGCVCTVSDEDRNIIWRWFTDPRVRQAYPPQEWEEMSRIHVADLRAALARRAASGPDPVARGLIERLSAASTEFAAFWERHEVGVRMRSRMRVQHDLLGPIDLECQTLLTPSDDRRLLIFTPVPGSDALSRLELLSVIGHEKFGPYHDPV